MRAVWLAWALLLAAQLSNEAVGQLDLPSPYTGEPMYGERAVFTLACMAFSFFLWRGAPGKPDLRLASFGALAALTATLLLSPINDRHFYVPAMAVAQFLMAVQAWAWVGGLPAQQERRAGAIVAAMQSLGFALFVYAQTAIGIEPLPPGSPGGALYYLHGPAADLMPALIGTLLLLWVSRRA